MLFIRLFFISILFFNTLHDDPVDKSIFISPLKIPLLLSSNFGELRIDHFHSGLDIKTQGVTGKEVVAAASGYIYRISVSPGGFGNALYIRHPSGYSTVYGHLDSFIPNVENYVKNQQYIRKSFPVALFPPKEKFPVRQGELIAYSGNSGSSGGPHLHYEIREAAKEVPVNPLLFEFGISDNIAPVIEKLVIYPINNQTLINNKNAEKRINVSGERGQYFIPKESNISISGPVGFGIKSFDRLNGSNNKCAAYSIELRIDSTLIFKYVMDGFSFNESRYINSHIDYKTYQKDNIYIERTYTLPNDKLSVYQEVVNRGIFDFNDDKVHFIELFITDVHNNRSALSFSINAQTAKSEIVPEIIDQNLKLMPYNKSNNFVTNKFSLEIPSGALYDNIYFSYEKKSGSKDMLSDIHHVLNKFTPLHKAATLLIKPTIIPSGEKSKMLIVHLGDDKTKSPIKSIWNEGYLKAEIMTFGAYYVGIDTVPPVISANGLVSGANLTGRKEIRIKISDDFSGIKSYEPTIDGNWALFEYDQKNDLLIYRFDKKRIASDTNHSLRLKVTDNTDNFSFFNCDFTW